MGCFNSSCQLFFSQNRIVETWAGGNRKHTKETTNSKKARPPFSISPEEWKCNALQTTQAILLVYFLFLQIIWNKGLSLWKSVALSHSICTYISKALKHAYFNRRPQGLQVCYQHWYYYSIQIYKNVGFELKGEGYHLIGHICSVLNVFQQQWLECL